MDSVMKQKRIIKSLVVVIVLILIITLPGSLYFTDMRIIMIIAAAIWFFLDKTDTEYLWYSAIFFLLYDQLLSDLYTHSTPSKLYLMGEAIFSGSFDFIMMGAAAFLAIMSLIFIIFAWIQNFRVISQNTFATISLILALFIFSLGAGIEGFLISPLYGLTIFLGRKIEKPSNNKTGELLWMHFLLSIVFGTNIHYYRVNIQMRIFLIFIICIIYLTYGLMKTEKNQEKVFKGVLIFQGLVSLVLIANVFVDKSPFFKTIPVISSLAQYFAIQMIFMFSPEIIRKDKPKSGKSIEGAEVM